MNNNKYVKYIFYILLFWHVIGFVALLLKIGLTIWIAINGPIRF